MKTLFFFLLGLIAGVVMTHVYHQQKTAYFDQLYSQYLSFHHAPMHREQFEYNWLNRKPWCFDTSTQTYCNAENAYITGEIIPENIWIDWHQQFKAWYPEILKYIKETIDWAIQFWDEKMAVKN